MKTLALTGLGNEVDLSTGRTIFTATFNKKLRIEITEEAAKLLTSAIYSESEERRVTEEIEDEPEHEDQFQAAALEDVPSSVYEEESGVEQV